MTKKNLSLIKKQSEIFIFQKIRTNWLFSHKILENVLYSNYLLKHLLNSCGNILILYLYSTGFLVDYYDQNTVSLLTLYWTKFSFIVCSQWKISFFQTFPGTMLSWHFHFLCYFIIKMHFILNSHKITRYT
jgi:hypothetical protein